MKYFISFATAVIVICSLSSCEKVVGDGPVITETRTVREFTELEFGVPGELEFIESEQQQIIIEAQRNIADVIQTYVSGNELRIKVKDSKIIRTSEPVRIIVQAPSVHSFAVSGPGKIIAGAVHGTELKARISGSGSIEVLEGSVDREEINISGSGNVDVVNVEARSASTQTSGSGNIRINATDELDVRISGSGDVYYKGSPIVDVSVSGSGRLVRL